jgi:putative ABC transport system permease protein
VIRGFSADLRHAFRALRARPLFSLSAIAILALGLGAGTALWSVVDAVLFRPMPYPDASRLVAVEGKASDGSVADSNLSSPDVADLGAGSPGLAALGAYSVNSMVLAGEPEPQPLFVGIATPGLFSTLAVQPALGRLPSEEEHVVGKHRVLVLSDRLWRARFTASPSVIGQSVELNGNAYTVIGVMPRGFIGPLPQSFLEPDAWRPLAAQPDSRGGHWLRGVARLKEGVSLAEAQAQIDAVSARLAREHPDTNTERSVRLVPLMESIAGPARKALLALCSAVGFLLLITCANVAGLLLTRAEERRRESAIRAALGAGRMRLARMVLVEALLLAAAGGLGGTLLAWWGTEALAALAGRSLPRLATARLDGRALVGAATLAVCAAILFGLLPALRQAGSDLVRAMNEGHGTASPARQRLLEGLVAGQLALSLVLLIGAGLLGTSVARLLRVPTGVRTDDVITFNLTLPQTRYKEMTQSRAFADQLLARLEALPGVRSAGISNILPMSGSSSCDSFSIPEHPPVPAGQEPCGENRISTPGYFDALGIPIVRGRGLLASDGPDAPPIVLINEAFAARYFPGEEPLGKHLQIGSVPRAIVGITADVRHFGPGSDPVPEYTEPYAQLSFPSFGVVLRSSLGIEGMGPSVRAAVRGIDPGLAVEQLETMRTAVAHSASGPRFRALVVSAFALAALLLAALGVYGLMAYSVSCRRREIGIRMALGAGRGTVARLVLGRGVRLAVIGGGLGLAGGAALTPLLSSLLFGVRPLDPFVFGGQALLLAGIAVAACAPAAWRATRVDPLRELRVE